MFITYIQIMEKKVTIFCTNTNTYQDFPAGSNLIKILEGFDVKSQSTIVNAKVNNKTEPLDYCVYHNKTVTFVDLTSPSGMRAYVRSLCFLLAKAVLETFPKLSFISNIPYHWATFAESVIGLRSTKRQ